MASGIGIVLNYLLAHFLGAESYGKIQYMVGLITTISSFLIFGLDSFILREAKNPKNEKSILNKSFSFLLITFIFGAPIVMFVCRIVEHYDFSNLLFYLFIFAGTVSLCISKIISSYFNGRRKVYASSLVELIIPKIILLSFVIVCIVLGSISFIERIYLGLYLLIYGSLSIVILLLKFKRVDLSFSIKEIVSITMLFGTTVTYSLTENLGKVLQGTLFRNTTVLGVVAVSLNIISLVSIFTSIINSIAKPMYAQLNRDNNVIGLIDVYRFNTRANSYFFLPLYLFFIICAKKFLFIFGESYTVYPLILVILSIRALASSITGPNGGMLTMTGHEKMQFVNGLIYFVVFVTSMVIFSSNEIYGLCFAFLITEVVINIIKYIEVWVVFKKTPLDLKTLLSMLMSVLFDSIAIYFWNYVNNIFIWLFAGIVIGIILIGCNFLFSPYRKVDFKRLLRFESEDVSKL